MLVRLKNAWAKIVKYTPLMRELVKRDIKVKYRRSFLGYLWSLLNPLLMMGVMTIVFSTMFQSTIPNFPLYLICGNMMFNCFNESTTSAMYSVIDNGLLIKKVYIPKYIFPISRVLSVFVTTSYSLLAILLVMIFTGAKLHWTILLFPIPWLLLLLFSFGIGMIVSSLSVYFRDLTHLYGVLTLAWMYLTPIFYPVSVGFLSQGVINLIRCNPLYYYVTFFRNVIIYGSIPSMNIWAIGVLYAFAALIVGGCVFHRMQKNFILHI